MTELQCDNCFFVNVWLPHEDVPFDCWNCSKRAHKTNCLYGLVLDELCKCPAIAEDEREDFTEEMQQEFYDREMDKLKTLLKHKEDNEQS